MNKKGLSEVIGYVLLIVIGISVAGFVGVWLSQQVPQDDTGKLCPEGASLVISDYNCTTLGGFKQLNLTIKNKGLFSVDGFTVKYNTKGTAIGLYALGTGATIDTTWGKKLVPEESFNFVYDFSKNVFDENGQIKSFSQGQQEVYLLEVQPFTIYNGEKNFCEKVSYKEINKAGCHA